MGQPNQIEGLKAILGVREDCTGDPTECPGCTPDNCSLAHNRLNDLGNMMLTILEEFRWFQAMATEMEQQKVLSKGTSKRVDLRVRREQIREQLGQVAKTLSGVVGVQVLEAGVRERIAQLRAELQDLDTQLGDSL